MPEEELPVVTMPSAPSRDVVAPTVTASLDEKALAAQHHERIFAWIHEDHSTLTDEEFQHQVGLCIGHSEIFEMCRFELWSMRLGTMSNDGTGR